MVTTAQNSDQKSGYDVVTGRPVTVGTAINQGDMVYNVGSTTYSLAPVTSDGNAATFEGISEDTYPTASLATKEAEVDGIRVRRHGIVNMNMTSAETYHHGDALYVGADAQTVTNTPGTGLGALVNIVGYVCLTKNVTSLAYSATGKVPMLIVPILPAGV